MTKKICMFLLSFFLISGLISFNAAQDKDKAKTEQNNEMNESEVKEAVDTKPFNSVCPVSGEEIESDEFTFAYEGKTYAVCCNNCLKKIKKNPERYTSRLSEDGKSLKKK